MRSLHNFFKKKFPLRVRAMPDGIITVTVFAIVTIPIFLAIATSALTPAGPLLLNIGAPLLGGLFGVGISIAVHKFSDRSYHSAGYFFDLHLKPIETALTVASERLKQSPLGKDSDPAILLSEARDLFSKVVISASRTHKDLERFDSLYARHFLSSETLPHFSPHYKGDDFSWKAVRDIPAEMMEETAGILRSLKPLRDFTSTFNLSLDAALEGRALPAPDQDLLEASRSFERKLEVASERAGYTAQARAEIKELFESDDFPTLKEPQKPDMRSRLEKPLAQ